MLARIKGYNTSFLAVCKKLLPKKGRQKFFVLMTLFLLVSIGVFGFTTPGKAILEEGINVLLIGFSWIMFILARLFIGITIFALKFFIEIASYNNFIDTPTVKIGWFLVRDVANMFFVVLLLVIAFGTILGLEQYEWKKTLIKLILAAVFINFSNMIAQLIIDVAHVFTITFVNAISATAGGNIIQLFNIDSVYKITGADKLSVGGDIKVEAFAASVASFILAAIMMTTMGAFAIVMAARMVILWVLIILSPLAYIFQVIPQTQKYAQEWWSEFTNHVIVAPVMVFFLWLAFATLNSSVPQLDFSSTEATSVIESGAQVTGSQTKLSISEATSWENLASFLIATVFLLIGLKVVRNLGVVAGGLTSSATGFVKNVATVATGYALGRAAYEGGTNLMKKGKDALVQPVKEFGTRVKQRVNIARTTTPYLRKIPFIGRLGQLRRQKLNEELDRNAKMTDENIIDTISRKENIGLIDRMGKNLGFGIESWKQKRYKLEGEEDVIQAEKAESKRARKAGVATKQADMANKAMADDGVVSQIAAKKEQALQSFRNDEKNQAEYGEVGEEWAKDNVSDEAIKAHAIQSLQKEKQEILEKGFSETQEGKKDDLAITALSNTLEEQKTNYNDKFKKFATSRVVNGVTAVSTTDFSEEDQEKIDAAKKKDPSKTENDVIKELVKNGNISVTADSEAGKKVRQKFAESRDGIDLDQVVGIRTASLATATKAREAKLNTYAEKNGAKVQDELLAKSGYEDRITQAREEAINKENVARREKSERAFATTKVAKDLVEESGKRILDLSDGIATGKVKLKDKDGNEVVADAQARQAIAERMRMQAKIVSGDRGEAEKKRAEAQLAGTFQQTEFGQYAMMMQDVAERAEAAAKNMAEVFKNDKIAKELKHAGELIELKMKLGGTEAGKALDKVLKKNVYAQAAQQSQILEKTKIERGKYETKLNESANALAVERKNYGEGTPTAALVPYAKRQIEALSSQEADAAGAYAQKIIAHILQDSVVGRMTGDQHSVLMGTTMSLAKGGYTDDAVGEVLKSIQRLDGNQIEKGSDEEKQIKNLKNIFVDQLGILEKNAQGRYVYDKTKAARFQQLVVTGGDTALVRDNTMISDIQEEAQKKGSVTLRDGSKVEKGDSYKSMLEKVSKAGMLLSGTMDDFTSKLEGSAEFMQEGASYFKREAFNTNHTEIGGHFKYDSDLGLYRMSTKKEASDLMEAENAKRKGKLASQIHAYGQIDAEKGDLLSIDRQDATSLLEELSSSQATRQMPQRTVNRMLGYNAGEEMVVDKKSGNAVVGKSLKYVTDTHGTFDNYMKNIVLPMLLANSESLKYMAREKAKHVDTISSDRGMARISIVGKIEGETNSKLLEEVIKYSTENRLINEDELATLQRGVSASKKKEATLDKRGRVSPSDLAAEEEVRSRD